MRYIAARLVITLVLIAFPVWTASAQTLTVLHTFSGGTDGGSPESALTMDSGGHLYGTALKGADGYGTVYKMTDEHGSWLFTNIYNFQGDSGNNDGAGPIAKVVIGPNGSLYGTTVAGGGDPNGNCADYGYFGCGTVYNLQPPQSVCKSVSCPWHETQLLQMVNGPGGIYPFGAVAFDHAGDIYGTTNLGSGLGTVYELTHSSGGWAASTLVSFTGSNGGEPYDTLVLDSSGNLYGTAVGGGANGYGVVFELSPTESGWTETILHSFTNTDGNKPYGGLIFDSAGNLYGATSSGGSGNGGTVFELSPSGGSWQFNVLYNLAGTYEFGPQDSLTMDSAANLYGTTLGGGANSLGTVFKLTHSGNDWVYSDLYDFSAGADGCEPNGGVVLDSQGNIYGATTSCADGYGTVWKLTQ